ncbi:hypothetical protein HGRIS_009976 [Hohenbuehelia grisea]
MHQLQSTPKPIYPRPTASTSSSRHTPYRYPPMAANPLGDTVTTIHVLNLHCTSCVSTIEDALSVLSPRPLHVEVSIVAQSVTVYHTEELLPLTIEGAIDGAGFDVVHDGDTVSLATSSHTTTALLPEKREKHLQHCSLCQEEYRASLDSQSRFVSHADHDRKAVDGNSSPHVVTLSVGGMTCSSCSGTITRMVSELPGVSSVVVSLIDKAATVVVDRPELVAQVTETIEDCGFEAEVVTVVPLESTNRDSPKDQVARTISLKIDGMFCQHCPKKVMAALEPFGPKVKINKPLEAFTDPIITLTYEPDAPTLTIRSIIDALANAKSPPFSVAVHKPPTVEQLARKLHAREQKHLLYRLYVSMIIAIPTFIIGIVFMTLVPAHNPTRMFLMEPLWAGNASRTEWALFFLATPVMFYSANLFHRRSLKEIHALWRRGSATPLWKRFVRFGSMNLLVSSGVSVAYFASVALLALAAVQDPAMNHMGETTSYFDSVVFLTMFLLAGRALESYSKGRTADAITALGSLRPAEAQVLVRRTGVNGADLNSSTSRESDIEKADAAERSQGFEIIKVSVDLLEVGDIVSVPNGATPPADGTIVSQQESAFDESSLTGESRLIKKHTGDQVFLGTLNRSNVVQVRIDAIGGETMLDRIVKVVREGQTRRAPIERVADLITGYFVPVVTLLAILTWLLWLVLGLSGALPDDYLDIQIGGWPVWSLGFAIAVFVIACPCGIGLAAPTALLVGSGLAAKFGILARGGGEAFQEMAQVDVVVFDKTGTLTQGGSPQVSDVQIFPSPTAGEATILAMAHELESASSHPLATAIRAYCAGQEKRASAVADGVEETSGRGMKATFPELRATAIIGNEAWMAAHGATVGSEVARTLDAWRTEAKSVVILAVRYDGEASEQESPQSSEVAEPGSAQFHVAAVFAVADPLRNEAPGVVAWLHAQGIRTWMVSGDNATTAAAVAKQVGIPAENVIAGVLPHEKAEKIEWLQRNAPKRQITSWSLFRRKARLNERCVVAMVGDGINDAPALTAADVGIAIGSGSDVAISSASFILLSSNLRSLITLTDLARKVFNRVKFNFVWAAMYNLAALPIAAGVIYPAGHIRLDAVWASLAMALS